MGRVVLFVLSIVLAFGLLGQVLYEYSYLPTPQQVVRKMAEVTDFSVEPPSTGKQNPVDINPVILRLSDKNTVILRGEINAMSVAKVQEEVLKKSAALGINDTIYLFLDTPGGEIESGEHLIDTLHSIPQRVNTITFFAASMGFVLVQSQNTRYILPSGVLMSHRARISGAQGQIPGEFIVEAADALHNIKTIEGMCSKRMGLTLEKYEQVIRDEYWVTGADAVQQNAADRLALINCDSSLLSKNTYVQVQTFFGAVALQFNNCPNVTGPTAVGFQNNIPVNKQEEAAKEAIENYYKLRNKVSSRWSW